MTSARTITMWSVGGAFFAYAYTSLLWSPEALYSGLYLLSLGFAFLLGVMAQNPRPAWWWFCAILSLNVVGFIVGFPLNGWFGNLNYAGVAIAFALSGALVYDIRWFYPFAAVGLYLSQSRTALAAVAALCFIWLWQRYLLLAFLLALACAFLIVTQKADVATTFAQRVGIWADTVSHLSFWGHGWGSFAADYAKFPVHTNMPWPQTAGHTYNDLLELVFELGIFAGLFWVLIITGLESHSWPILLVYTALSVTYFPLAILGVGQLLAFTLGHASEN